MSRQDYSIDAKLGHSQPATMNRIGAFQLCCYRHTLKITWTEKTQKTEVLERRGRKSELLNIIKKKEKEIARLGLCTP